MIILILYYVCYVMILFFACTTYLILHRRLLTDMKITDIASAKVAMNKLHEMGAKTVIISSSDLGTNELLIGLGSDRSSNNSE